MSSIELLSLPTFRFAHIHRADRYQHTPSCSTSRLEISYLAEGSLLCETADGSCMMEKGDIACCGPVPLTIRTPDFHCHHTVCVDVDWRFTEAPGHLTLPPVTRSCAAAREIAALIDDFIYHSYRYESAPEKTACDFLQILCKIHACHTEATADSHSGSSILVQRAKKYIHHNIYRPISQEEIAQRLGITPGYLCSIFRQSEQTTVMKYINTLKLRQIRELMEARNMKLYEAAAMFGYSDPNYVSSLYKKTFGHSITSSPNRSMSDSGRPSPR